MNADTLATCSFASPARILHHLDDFALLVFLQTFFKLIWFNFRLIIINCLILICFIEAVQSKLLKVLAVERFLDLARNFTTSNVDL